MRQPGHKPGQAQGMEDMTMMNTTTKYTPFYTRANGALKCRETEDGYTVTTHYGHQLTQINFCGLDDMAEYIYFTAADESDTVLSIQRDMEKHLREHHRQLSTASIAE
jgi:hypothetical protein